jgi:hypothetical protein
MQAETKSAVPGLLATVITLGFFGVLIGMMTDNLSPTETPALMMALGALMAGWGSVVNYYFGSSAGSRVKDETIIASMRNR